MAAAIPAPPRRFGGTPEKDITLALGAGDPRRARRDRPGAGRADPRGRHAIWRSRSATRSPAGSTPTCSSRSTPTPRRRTTPARGATIYTLSEVASDREAALLAAARERGRPDRRRAGSAPIPSVNLILIDLAQRESMNVSADFAAPALPRGRAGLPVPPRLAPLRRLHRAEGARHALDPVRIAAISPTATDAAYISSPEGRRQIAEGMRRAIEAHFARRFLPTQG